MSSTAPDPGDLIARSITPDDVSDQRRSLDLLAHAQQGDRASLEELLTRHQDDTRRIVRIRLGRSMLRREPRPKLEDFEERDREGNRIEPGYG